MTLYIWALFFQSSLYSVGLPIVLALCVLWPLFFVWDRRRAIMLRNAKVPHLFEPRIVRISEQNVQIETLLTDTKLKWPVFSEIAENKDYVFLFTNKTNAMIVPKSSFTHPAEAQQFFVTATHYWKSALEGPAPTPIQQSGTWPPAPRVAS